MEKIFIKSRKQKIKMIARTTTLTEICTEMSGIKVSFKKVKARFLQYHPRTNGYYRNLGSLTGKLAELHTLERAEELERRYPGQVEIYRIKEEVDPGIRKYTQSQDGTPNIFIVNTISERRKGEIDMVLIINGTPVIVETHIASYRRTGDNNVAEKLKPETIERKRKYIHHLLDKRPEIVHVLSEEQVRRNAQNGSTMLAQYLAAGNYVVTFPWNRHEWRVLAESFTFNLV